MGSKLDALVRFGNSALGLRLGQALLALSVLLGIGSCYHLARTADADYLRAQRAVPAAVSPSPAN